MKQAMLASAKLAFEQWRMQRSSRSESIPEDLWEMAKSLYPYYKRSTICQQLRLSGTDFRQRLEESCHRLPESGFVLASGDMIDSHSKQLPGIPPIIPPKTR